MLKNNMLIPIQAPARWSVLCAMVFSILLIAWPETGIITGNHGFLTAHGLALAEHWRVDHGLFLMHRWELHGDTLVALPYNRFPAFPFIVLSGVTDWDALAPWKGPAWLMKGCGVAAFGLGCCIMHRLLKDTVIAILVTLLSFSGYYFLFYHDMVFNDLPGLVAWMAVLLGIIEIEQSSRYKIFFIATIVSCFITWQPLFLAIFYWVLCSIRQPRHIFSHHAPVTAAVVLGSLLSGAQIGLSWWSEARVTGIAFSDLDSVRSVMARLGLREDFNAAYSDTLSLKRFIPQQIYRIGMSALPAVFQAPFGDWKWFAFASGSFVLFILPVMIWRRLSDRFCWAMLALSGFAWVVPMRNFVAFHDFQSLWYVGLVMAFFGLLFSLPLVTRCVSKIPKIALATIVALNILSLVYIEREKNAPENLYSVSLLVDALLSQREITKPGDTVYVDVLSFGLIDNQHVAAALLPNRIFTENERAADYVIRYPAPLGRGVP